MNNKSNKKIGDTREEVLKLIQELTDFVINYESKRKEELKKYIKEYNLKPLIEKEYSIDYCDMEEENIVIDDIEIYGVCKFVKHMSHFLRNNYY